MPTFRKGLEAIEESANKSNNKFQPFVPQVAWKEDKEEKYILMLTPISETVTVDLHEWIQVGEGKRRDGTTFKNYEQFISRKDKGIGEDYDDIEQRLNKLPRRRTLGVAVELEPVMEQVQGRQRPKGFEVKTETFTRDNEEVTAPVIGIVSQASKNFFGWLGSFDNSQAPVTETPLQVLRRGKDADTTYDFIPFMGAEVDLSTLFDTLGEVSYLSDEAEELVAELKNYDNDFDAASYIGQALLDKRVQELADADRYKELIDPIKELPASPFDRKPSTNGRSTRPERPSPRAVVDESEDSDDETKRRFSKLRDSLES